MEDNIQTIIVVIISAFLLFIFPVYMAYEKKDDISYALAMRYTQDLVDEVRSKGYISKYMYEDYRAKLKVTGNSYDIQMTHEYNRYDPITNYYKEEDGKYTLVKTTTQEDRQAYEENLLNVAISTGKLDETSSLDEKEKYIKEQYKKQDITKVENTYMLSKQIYNTDHIVSILNGERKLKLNAESEAIDCKDVPEAEDGCQYAYIMNVDDNFNVTIKNTNITLATVIYNMVTANTLDDNTRIYVNYGGTILSSKWFGEIDYAKMKHDEITLSEYTVKTIFDEERKFEVSKAEENPLEQIAYDPQAEYTLEFDVKPEATTDLRQKGKINNFTSYNFNFAAGNRISNNSNPTLSVSVGINGITLITNHTNIKSAAGTFSLEGYTKEQKVERTNEYGETYIETKNIATNIRDYSKISIQCNNKGKVKFILEGKAGVDNITRTIDVVDTTGLLQGLNWSKENPVQGEYTGSLNGNRYEINITDKEIAISITKTENVTTTILSYPITIDRFVNVKVEMKKNEDGEYVAVLYVDSERLDESIPLDVMPKVNVIGKTIVESSTRYFEGTIKNAKIHVKGE